MLAAKHSLCYVRYYLIQQLVASNSSVSTSPVSKLVTTTAFLPCVQRGTKSIELQATHPHHSLSPPQDRTVACSLVQVVQLANELRVWGHKLILSMLFV